MTRRTPWLALGAASCLATPLQRADTLGARQYEVAVEGGTSTLDQRLLPTGNLAVRYGVSDHVDLGVRVGTQLYEVQSKFLLGEVGADVPVSLAPSLTVVYGRDPLAGSTGDPIGLVFASVPALIGVPLPGGHQLVLGPGIAPTFGVSADGPAVLIEPRLSVGLSARLSSAVRLHPELGASVDAFHVGPDGFGGSDGLFRLSAGIGVAFGNGYRDEP